MNSLSQKSLSRVARLSIAGLLALALSGRAAPAQAVVSPSSGEYEFTMYEDNDCEGDTFRVPGTASNTTLKLANTALFGFGSVASSWSFCNSTSQTALALITLYTGLNYTGTSIISTVSVPSGQCMTKTKITPDNAVNSFSIYIYLH